MGVLLSAFLSGLTLGTVGTAAAGTGVAVAAGVATLAGGVAGTMASSSHQQTKAAGTAKSIAKSIAAGNIEEARQMAQKSQEAATAKVTLKKRAMARSSSVFSSPLGIGTQAATSRKTLLGQ